MDYLIHFNGLHSSKNGRFISGDGDGDGLFRDEFNKRNTPSNYYQSQVSIDKAQVKSICTMTRKAAGKVFAKTQWGKLINASAREISNATNLKNQKWFQEGSDKFYTKLTEKINNSL